MDEFGILKACQGQFRPMKKSVAENGLYSTSGRTEQGDCMVFFPVFSIQFLYFLLAFGACTAFSFVKGTG